MTAKQVLLAINILRMIRDELEYYEAEQDSEDGDGAEDAHIGLESGDMIGSVETDGPQGSFLDDDAPSLVVSALGSRKRYRVTVTPITDSGGRGK